MLYKFIGGLLLALLLRHVHYFVDLLGFYQTVRTHWPGPCRNIDPIKTGAESIVVTRDGLAFITSGLVPQYRAESVDPRMRQVFEGMIYKFDFNSPEKDAVPLEIDQKFDFMPHGMSLLEDGRNGEVRLFVVNHRENEDTVEILTYDSGTSMLHHVSTISHPLFTSLNGVVADGPETFYATNDGYFNNSTLRAAEQMLALPWGSVVYFDGKSARKVVNKMYEPNGIALSPDKSTVFVTMPFLKYVYVYNRQADNSLVLAHELKVDVPFDNVHVHPKTGHLWLGALVQPYMVAAAAGNIDVTAPGMACRLEPTGPETDAFQSFRLYEVFADTTGLLSTSSCAVEYDGKLLIGSIFQKLAYCDLETKY